MRPYEAICGHMRPYAAICGHRGPNGVLNGCRRGAPTADLGALGGMPFWHSKTRHDIAGMPFWHSRMRLLVYASRIVNDFNSFQP